MHCMYINTCATQDFFSFNKEDDDEESTAPLMYPDHHQLVFQSRGRLLQNERNGENEQNDCSFILFSSSSSLTRLSIVPFFSLSLYRKRDLHFLSYISKRSVNTFLILLNRITNCTYLQTWRRQRTVHLQSCFYF